jgi:uncharacterized membrane protein YphA (DoxX/SURF4 family)
MAKSYRVTTFARINNTMIASLLRLGIKVWSFSPLTVRGSKSGKPIVAPIAVFVQDQKRYLVAPYGVVNWVRNLRAAKGVATLTRRRHSERIHAIELSPEAVAPIFRAAPRSGPPGIPAVIFRLYRSLWVLPYLGVAEHSSLEEFEREVLTHPVFLVQPAMEHVFQESSPLSQETKKNKKGKRKMSTLSVKEDMTMKRKVIGSSKMIGYWAITIIVALELLVGGVTDLVHGREVLVVGQPVVLVLAPLGYPVYLLTILGVWKLLGAIALLAPRFPRLKEWAYAGTFFEMTGAAASHVARGDNASALGLLIFAALILASWALRPPSRTLGVLFQARARREGQGQPSGQDVSTHGLF